MKFWGFIITVFFAMSSLATPEYCKNEKKHILPVCQDQVQLMQQAVAQAKANNGLLFVMAGATWCPWTKGFMKEMKTAGVLPENSRYIEVGVNHKHAGQRVHVQSGIDAIQNLIAAASSDQKYNELVKGFPSVILFKASNTGELIRVDNAKMVGPPRGWYTAEMIRAEFKRLADGQ